MPRRKWNDGLKFMGRPRTAKPYTWGKQAYCNDEMHPKAIYPGGVLMDITPAPGRTYTRLTWPPRGRGRGESLISIRRVHAKQRAVEVFRLHVAGFTFEEIGCKVGLSPSGAYRAMRRLLDRLGWDEKRKRQLRLERLGITEAELASIRSLDDVDFE